MITSDEGTRRASGARIGAWTLDWRLGSGAGGDVFRARHDDGRVGALKFARPGAAARLAREAELLAILRHPAFPALYERLPDGYAMAWVAGRRLDAVARAWSAEAARSLLGQLADALAALHALGWVHRDVSAANVLVEPDGRLRLLDLGAACPIDGGGDLTEPGRVVGARPLPPEGPVATPARDAWSVGALFAALGVPEDGPLRATIDGLADPDPRRRLTLAAVAAALGGARPIALSRTLGATGPAAPPPTATLGRYLLLEEIGRGGMGVVFRAWDPLLQRAVAVKTAAGGDGPRLVREAQAVGALDHPAICRVFDAGVDDGVPWLAMELLPGGTVAGLVVPGGLDAERAVGLVAAVAEGLAAAHRAGLVHRDVKPSNLLLDEAGAPRLSDFGLVTGPVDGALTQQGLVLGTLRYMAPEQARGEPATPASDVYGLGVVLYELLSGRTPHDGGDAFVALTQRGVEPGRPLRAVRRVDPDLDAVVARATAFDPADRYPDARAFADDLGRRLRREPVHAIPPSWRRRARGWAHRHRTALRAAGATVVGVAVVALTVAGGREVAARVEAARVERDAEAAIQLAERVVEARRATDPSGAEALFDEVARSPLLQGTAALAEAWLREAARRDDPDARAQALARAWLGAPTSHQERVLRAIADVHAANDAREKRASTAGLLEELGFGGDGPDPLVRDGALAFRQLAHPKVVADPDLGAILGAWAVGTPGPVPPGTPGWRQDGPAWVRGDLRVVPPPGAGMPHAQGDVLWFVAAAGFVRRAGGVDQPVPVPLARLAVTVEPPLEADLDGDGATELLFHTSFWRGWDLQVVDARTGAARGRTRWGSTHLAGAVRAGQRELAIVQSTRQFGSRIVFPSGSPYGRPTGLALVGLSGDRFDVVFSMDSERAQGEALVGDLDGDGRDDVIVPTVSGMIVVRQRAEGAFAGAFVAGVTPVALVQADADAALELDAVVDGEGLRLGVGDRPVPPIARPRVSRPNEPDLALRRAMELAAIGLEDEAIAGLEAIRAVEGDGVRGARAALLQGSLTPGAASDALYARAAARPEVAEEARAAKEASARAEGRVGEPLVFDLRRPLEAGWRVDRATGVRWSAEGQQVELMGVAPVLRLPVEIVDDQVRLELDATVDFAEWGSQVRLGVTDEAGTLLAASILPSRGGRQAVRVGLVCAAISDSDTVLVADAPRPRLASPWWLTIASGTSRCGLGRTVGLPEARSVPRGPAWVVIAAANADATVARIVARTLTVWGARRRDGPPVDAAGEARWRLARLEAREAREVAPEGSVERAVAQIELGQPAGLDGPWAASPGAFPTWLRAEGPEVGAWVRQAQPAAWPALWWEAYGQAIWQHPDDPEIQGHLIDDLPDALDVAARVGPWEGIVMRTMRGRALRHAGALAAAEAHQESALAAIRAALATTSDPAERAMLHDVLVLVVTERAALAIARGDEAGAVAACREGLALDPIPEYLADGLGDHPALAGLRDREDFRALLAGVPGWEGPHAPR